MERPPALVHKAHDAEPRGSRGLLRCVSVGGVAARPALALVVVIVLVGGVVVRVRVRGRVLVRGVVARPAPALVRVTTVVLMMVMINFCFCCQVEGEPSTVLQTPTNICSVPDAPAVRHIGSKA